MNCSMPGLPVHHQLPELTQTHIHRVGDAIQPSHPLLSPLTPAPNPSEHSPRAPPHSHSAFRKPDDRPHRPPRDGGRALSPPPQPSHTPVRPASKGKARAELRPVSRSGGEKGLRGSGAGTLGVPLEGSRRVGPGVCEGWRGGERALPPSRGGRWGRSSGGGGGGGAPRQRPRESFFNASRGPSPLP